MLFELALSTILFTQPEQPAPQCVYQEAAWCVAAPASINEAQSKFGDVRSITFNAPSDATGYFQVHASPGCQAGAANELLTGPSVQTVAMGPSTVSRAWNVKVTPTCELLVLVRSAPADLDALSQIARSSLRFCEDDQCRGGRLDDAID